MPYLIDGHNLIPHIPGLDLKTVDDEMQLVKLLQAFSWRVGKHAEVYFDNAHPGGVSDRTFGPVKAHFIRKGRSADHAIMQRLLGLGKKAQNWTVVSSDREIQTHARAQRARVISSEDFAHQLTSVTKNDSINSTEKLDIEMSDAEVEDWLKIFQEDD